MPRAVVPTAGQLEELASRDPVLGDAMRRVAPFPGFPRGPLARGSHFQAIARSIVYQQLAGSAAKAIFERVCALTPGPAFPRAQECLALPEERLRSAGLSTAKARSIRELAAACDSGSVQLRSVSRRSDPEIVQMLTTVWGIGEWTAQMFLIFRLGRLDIMPTSDLGIREGVRRLDGLEERPSAKEVGRRAELWQPLRSVAAWILYRLCD
ncbi:MAG: DNA-3-methyladenine glycosylase 2 family protein [Gemmatimonadetes bacterium]|nr:DNA-3-methyladenine glycosylase 2 family protein [Gemmatimonadota bacterium]